MNAITVRQQRNVTDNVAIGKLVDDWKAHLRISDLSQNTQDTYIRGWAKFWSWLLLQDVTQVDGDTIRTWITAMRRNYSPNTVNVHLSGVRAFFSWAVGNRYLSVNPTEGVRSARRRSTTKKHLKEVLTNGEVLRILDMPDRSTNQGKRDYAVLCLKAFTAARDVELHRADLADLRTQNGKLVLYVRGKGREISDEFIVITHPNAETAIHDWIAVRGKTPGPLFTSISNRSKNKRLSLRSYRRLVMDYYADAGVHGEKKTSHSLRHTAITNAIRHNAPIQKVQSMARHADIKTTMVYYHEVDRIDDPGEGYIEYDSEDEK